MYSEDEGKYFPVCKEAEVPEGKGKSFFVNNTELALFKVSGSIYALKNICPHQHSEILHDGFIEDGYVVCPAHGWQFNLQDGKQPGGRRGVPAYPVKTENGIVSVLITESKVNW